MADFPQSCPQCAGPCYDERTSKFWNGGLTTNGKKKPVAKCKDKNCGGVIWPPKEAEIQRGKRLDEPKPTPRAVAPRMPAKAADEPPPPDDQDAPVTSPLAARFAVYDQCFAHALGVAARAEDRLAKMGHVAPLDVAAIAATLWIQVTK